jgi:hypothetical protein
VWLEDFHRRGKKRERKFMGGNAVNLTNKGNNSYYKKLSL